MSRIRYCATSTPNVFKSVRVYHHDTNGARYSVLLDLNEKKWQVLDDGSGKVAAEGTGVNPHMLKKAARDALERQGVIIEMESRKKRIQE